jgi:putative membrane protein
LTGNNTRKENIALFIALLFHVCGLLGILFTPYKQWFINNTPVNLLLMAALLVFTQRNKSFGFWIFFFLCFFVGIVTEIIGANTGFLFGNYSYGPVLGAKIYNVPWIIGINWFTTIFCAGNIVFRLNEWILKKFDSVAQPSFAVQFFSFVFDGAMLATIFDWVLEPVAQKLDYWQWVPKEEVPVFNFVCWFIISVLLLTVFRVMRFDKHNHFALHLFIIQVLFLLVLQTFL